ncbi:MAG: hypothetical protein IT537_21245 [Hyphomicrobiales bacterium]|nr:hypothetical protein [Hyphomicrobiales bacterium]
MELGYQFSDNMDVIDLSPGSPWPYGAHSGNYSALNDYGGTGVITKVGGGTFAFDSTYIKGWANNGIAAGTITGYLNGNPISSVQFSTTGGNWQHVIANFLSVDEVRIVGDFFLLDDTQINGPSSVPIPATLPLFASGLGLLGLAGWRKRRKSRA